MTCNSQIVCSVTVRHVCVYLAVRIKLRAKFSQSNVLCPAGGQQQLFVWFQHFQFVGREHFEHADGNVSLRCFLQK